MLVRNRMLLAGILGAGIASVCVPAFAGGSDAATPYTVSEAGITLPAGQVFQDNGHVNIRTTTGSYGIHFESLNNQPSGKWIGQSFLPWSAFGLDPAAVCVVWVQIAEFNEHFGEGGQAPVGAGCSPAPSVTPTATPSATPTPTATPSATPSPTTAPTSTPTPSATVPATPEPTVSPTVQPTAAPSATAVPLPSSYPTPVPTVTALPVPQISSARIEPTLAETGAVIPVGLLLAGVGAIVAGVLVRRKRHHEGQNR